MCICTYVYIYIYIYTHDITSIRVYANKHMGLPRRTRRVLGRGRSFLYSVDCGVIYYAIIYYIFATIYWLYQYTSLDYGVIYYAIIYCIAI